MATRFGGKFGTSHSTMTDAAALISDIARKCPEITRIVHSVITSHRGSSGSSRRIKMQPDGHAIKLSVTANASHQVLYIYTSDKEAAQKFIKEGAEKKHFHVSIT